MNKTTEKILLKMDAAGFEQCEVQISKSSFHEVELDSGEMALYRTTEESRVDLTGVHSGRYARVTFNQLIEPEIERAVENLRSLAESAQPDSDRQLAEGQGEIQRSYGALEPDLKGMARRVSALADEARSHYPNLNFRSSSLSHAKTQIWRCNNRGLNYFESKGSYRIFSMFTGRRGLKCSSINFTSGVMKDLTRPLVDQFLTRECFESSLREVDHQPLKGKFEAQVLMEPVVALQFLEGLLEHIGDGSILNRTSRWANQLGERVCSSCLTLEAIPHSEDLADNEFITSDGFMSGPSFILDKGFLKGLLLSDYGSRKSGHERRKSSGSLLSLQCGNRSLEKMIKNIKRGVYLRRFSGGHPSPNGDFSGVAKNSYLIENGEVIGPISEVNISGNLFELFNGVAEVSSEVLNSGTAIVPWVSFDRAVISGAVPI